MSKEYQHRSSWKDDARITQRKKVTQTKSKPCPKCGTFSYRRFGDPCPFCFYLDSNEQRQYVAWRQWRSDKKKEQREDAELDRIMGN